MQTTLAPGLRAAPAAAEAAELIGACVHCGFCNAACPTYRLLGDELDGPRGRIYLVRGLLETGTATAVTQQHLDRCLTCRACEPACPSGVQYGRIVDLGRELAQTATPRSGWPKLQRAALRRVLTNTALFSALLSVARWCRPLLPVALRRRLPPAAPAASLVVLSPHGAPAAQAVQGALPAARRVLRLAGCVQPALQPGTGAATTHVLALLGIDSVFATRAGCCGALRQHLDDPAGALDDARRNIDAWWPQIEAGAEAIVMDASACGLMLREYGARLQHDPQYAVRAARVSALVLDVAELVERELPRLAARLAAADDSSADRAAAPRPRVAFHPPCTLQHGQRLRGVVEGLLARAGADVVPFADAQQCCGSAGAWSLLEPELAEQLRTRKLAALEAARPDLILSANIGCIAHLAAASGTPVIHWIEWLASRLGVAPR
jgi:glycolate oxidase iron-sulfur subunit